jgi:hypothetical protein
VTLDDIRRFRQLDGRRLGIQYHWVSGVETTTSPLGRGVATSVGMAIAQWLAAHNQPGFEIFDWRIYTVCGDGCMMEDRVGGGVARGAPRARQPLLGLRQQPHHDQAARASPSRRMSRRFWRTAGTCSG